MSPGSAVMNSPEVFVSFVDFAYRGVASGSVSARSVPGPAV